MQHPWLLKLVSTLETNATLLWGRIWIIVRSQVQVSTSVPKECDQSGILGNFSKQRYETAFFATCGIKDASKIEDGLLDSICSKRHKKHFSPIMSCGYSTRTKNLFSQAYRPSEPMFQRFNQIRCPRLSPSIKDPLPWRWGLHFFLISLTFLFSTSPLNIFCQFFFLLTKFCLPRLYLEL